MRLAYLFDRPLPAIETDSEQALQTLTALARRGHQVTLVLPEMAGRPTPTASALRDYYQVEGAFDVETVSAPLGRVAHARKLWHAWASIKSQAASRADVLYTRNFPTLFRLARQPKPYVYETYRPWMDQLPVLRPPFRAALASPQCLGAVLHSRYAMQRFQQLGLDAAALVVVHNGFNPARFTPAVARESARDQLGLARTRPLAVYTGHVNLTKGLDSLLSIAKQCPDIDFLMVGSEGRGLVERLGQSLNNVQFIPWQPFDRTVLYLFAADFLVLPPSHIPLKVIGNTVLPMKLFLYLAAGRPILAPHSDDTAELLRDGENATLVSPGDTAGAASALRRLRDDPELARRLGATAQSQARELTWDARAQKIETFLNSRLTSLGIRPASG